MSEDSRRSAYEREFMRKLDAQQLLNRVDATLPRASGSKDRWVLELTLAERNMLADALDVYIGINLPPTAKWEAKA